MSYYTVNVKMKVINNKPFVNLVIDSLDEKENLSVILYYFENSYFLSDKNKKLFLEDKIGFILENTIRTVSSNEICNSRLLRVLE